MRIVSIGEIIWDVVAPSEYLGGAPLNFAAHAHKLGHEVYLLSAVGDDERGRRALEGLKKCGISTDFVQVVCRQAYRHRGSRTRYGRQAHVPHRAAGGLRFRGP